MPTFPTPYRANVLPPPNSRWAIIQFPEQGYSSIIAAADIGQRMQRVWASIDTPNPTPQQITDAVREAERIRGTESN